MSKFTYIGENKNGEEVTQTVEAKDRFAVYEVARSNGHTVKQIKDQGKFSLKNLVNIEKIESMISRVSLDELVLMSRNLGAMLSAGLALSRALSVVERQSKNPRLKLLIKNIRERINAGDAFNEALKEDPKTFSDLYVAMVRAGEEGGSLAETLQTLSIQMERASTL